MGPIGTFWQVPNPLPREIWTRGELLALRAWRLVRWEEDGGLRLGSLSQGDVWHGPVFRADFRPEAKPGCGSGVYAIKPSRRPRRNNLGPGSLGVFDWLTGPDTWIWGWVALSGQVVEHVEGYRAEVAVVRRLHLGVQAHLAFPWPGEIEALMRDLEIRYQCPVKAGYWESRKAIRILSIKDLPASRLPKVPILGPRDLPPARLPAIVPVRVQGAAPVPAPISLRQSAHVPKQKRAAPKGPAPQVVAVAIRKAERKLGARWQLAGNGHDRRVTLRGWYSRAARRVTSCWERVHPHEAAGWLILWPLAVVLLAAKILRVQPATLIGREY